MFAGTNYCLNLLRHYPRVCKHVTVRNYAKVGIIGVPFEKGQKKEGVAQGPDAIRKAGLIPELINLGLDVKDFGNIKYEAKSVQGIDNMTHLSEVAGCTYKVSETVAAVMKEGRTVVTIGGDHSVGVGTIDGHVSTKGSNIAVLWVDAHADLNTNKTSDSGNVHGMPVALLTSELSDYWPHLPGMDWQKPMLSIRNVAYIGLRSVDKYERLVIEKFGITAFGMEDVERHGIHQVVHMALERIDPHSEKSIHVSFDIDALDPLEAPSTGTLARGGLTLREGIHLMEQVHRTRRLNAIDLVEVNPQIGDTRSVELTTEAAIYILQAALGYNRRGIKVPAGITDMPLQTFN
ncbi:arginase, hepatic [Microplitis demolitor]|uniref:arginase, hepatic n=1 Tax=Microplitis demolitor TaxID=69319 RepID=UPI0004CDD9C3|nr:arginase, hepatic [Microplitis demolitor]